MTLTEKEINEKMQELQHAMTSGDVYMTSNLLRQVKDHLASKDTLVNLSFDLAYNTMLDEDVVRLVSRVIQPCKQAYIKLYELVLEDDVQEAAKFLRKEHIPRQTLFMHNFSLLTFCSSIAMCKLLLQARFSFIAYSAKHAYESVEYLLSYPAVFEYLCLSNQLQPDHHPKVAFFWTQRLQLIHTHVFPSLNKDILSLMKQLVLSS